MHQKILNICLLSQVDLINEYNNYFDYIKWHYMKKKLISLQL